MGELCVNCGIGTRHYCAACSSEFARSNLDPVIDQRDEARRGLREMHIAADRFLRERDEARAEVEVLAEQVARMNVEGLRDDRRAAAEAARWKAEAERLREAIKPRGLSAGGGTDA